MMAKTTPVTPAADRGPSGIETTAPIVVTAGAALA